MSGYNLTGYLIFALVTTITPGPNNYLLFAYGKQNGIKGAWKLMSGIFWGFFAMLCIVGYGITGVITSHPAIDLILRLISSAWLLYLAIVLSKLSTQSQSSVTTNIGFIQGFLMQFVNPKAWIMAISGAAAFLPALNNIHLNVLFFATVFNLVGLPCMISWVFFGDLISRWLTSEKAHKTVGWVLFFMMLISIITIWV